MESYPGSQAQPNHARRPRRPVDGARCETGRAAPRHLHDSTRRGNASGMTCDCASSVPQQCWPRSRSRSLGVRCLVAFGRVAFNRSGTGTVGSRPVRQAVVSLGLSDTPATDDPRSCELTLVALLLSRDCGRLAATFPARHRRPSLPMPAKPSSPLACREQASVDRDADRRSRASQDPELGRPMRVAVPRRRPQRSPGAGHRLRRRGRPPSRP